MMKIIGKITLMVVVAVTLVGCFKDTVAYTDYRIAVYTQPTKDSDYSRAENLEAYAYYVDTTDWAIRSWEDAVAGRITNKVSGEVLEQPDVSANFNYSDENQLSLIINGEVSMLVLVDHDMQVYAYRKYQLPINLPQVDTKLYITGWKPSQASAGWRVVNPFYEK